METNQTHVNKFSMQGSKGKIADVQVQNVTNLVTPLSLSSTSEGTSHRAEIC